MSSTTIPDPPAEPKPPAYTSGQYSLAFLIPVLAVTLLGFITKIYLKFG